MKIVRAERTHQSKLARSVLPGKDSKRMQEFAQRLINAQEDERQRIARAIHDDLGNRIALMALSTHRIIKQTAGNPQVSSDLQNLLQEIIDFSKAARELSHGLDTTLLRHAGIKAALEALREKFEEVHGIRVNLVIAEEMPRIADQVALCIFRMAEESLQNVAKHSGAATATVVLAAGPGRIRLTVSDTGRGFIQSEATLNSGLGLPSMEARAHSVEGQLNINTSRGAGVEVSLTIPIQDDVSRNRVR
jgi:signal transduction histidine kinase